jgi:hypothetical protein
MPRQVVEYRVLIISPGDMVAARDAVRSAIADWNAHVGVTKGVRLEAVGWESHAHPASGAEPQAIINKQVGDDCDIGVALFGSRFGSPTSAAPSGSAEEIQRLLARKAPVMIYRSTDAVKLDAVDLDQVAGLRKFLDGMKSKALLGDFENVGALRHLLTMHLTKVIDEMLSAAAPSVAGVVTAPLPDVRVSVAVGIPMPEPSDPRLKAVVTTKAENHSPSPFFFNNYYFELDNGDVAQPMSDALTFAPVAAQVIQPGDSVSYNVSALVLMQQAKEKKAKIVRAVVVDKIGRKFFSTPESVQIAFKNAKTVLGL